MAEPVHFESLLERFPDKGGYYFIIVPDEVAEQFVEGRKPVRMVCLLNGNTEFQCAIRPKGGGGFYINVATALRTQAKIRLGDNIHVQVWKDESIYGRDMPEELTELLAIDEEGNRLFHMLIPSHQRGIIHYVASSSVVQTRIDRAIKMIDRLKVKSF
ncbi:YdeI/OmpD-associated family protein [Dyadobacter sp. LHD-138]|uniref:YdeI/OmpD-associated family protein n=1 Tax=Dyadobacter sp. LHD-138 TaxID=3071413 RepID=UPI0027E03910|nr:YdeI/OmpD-associated family protein [Dyadobacter sp. LHD-138]MDQ6482120.1 YdeI/OmpD-associated family protein [Dyadobacter sp. LHD-138]